MNLPHRAGEPGRLAGMRHFPLRELGYGVGFLAACLATLYVGAFYALVKIDGPPRPFFSFVDSSWKRILIG